MRCTPTRLRASSITSGSGSAAKRTSRTSPLAHSKGLGGRERSCRALPALAEVDRCPGLRTDGVYVEAAPSPGDMLLKLQTKPDAFGILAYGNEFLNADEFSATPIRGVLPTRQSIADETYPGSRPVYVYYDRLMSWVTSFLLQAAQSPYHRENFAIIPPERSQQ